MLVLCEAHHRQRHEGWLVIEGEAPEFRFRTRSGALLPEEQTREGEFACANSEVGARRSREAAAGEESGTEGGEFAHANSRSEDGRKGGEFAHANSRSADGAGAGVGPAFELAELTLGRLGLGARERRRRLREVLARQGKRGWSAEELVRAVLVAARPEGGRSVISWRELAGGEAEQLLLHSGPLGELIDVR